MRSSSLLASAEDISCGDRHPHANPPLGTRDSGGYGSWSPVRISVGASPSPEHGRSAHRGRRGTLHVGRGRSAPWHHALGRKLGPVGPGDRRSGVRVAVDRARGRAMALPMNAIPPKPTVIVVTVDALAAPELSSLSSRRPITPRSMLSLGGLFRRPSSLRSAPGRRSTAHHRWRVRALGRCGRPEVR